MAQESKIFSFLQFQRVQFLFFPRVRHECFSAAAQQIVWLSQHAPEDRRLAVLENRLRVVSQQRKRQPVTPVTVVNPETSDTDADAITTVGPRRMRQFTTRIQPLL